MLEYLACNLRQQANCYFLDGPTRQLYKLHTIVGCFSRAGKPTQPSLALRVLKLGPPYSESQLGIYPEALRLLRHDGLEYSTDGDVQGSGVRNVGAYFESEKEYFPS